MCNEGQTNQGTFRDTGNRTGTDVVYREPERSSMGDRGGKKAKEKNQQQQVSKQKEKQQQKDNKAATRAPSPAGR
jgi:hypothetical protein